jgi:Na+/melibiose symporter-like transporter
VSLDPAGSVLLATVLVSLLVPLTFAGEWGWRAARTWGLLLLSAAALVAFVAVERLAPEPVLDLRLLTHNRLFAAANGAALLNYLAVHAVGLLTAVFLEVVQGRPAAEAGAIMLSQPVLMASLSPLSGRLSDRLGSRLLATAGMALVAVGTLTLALLPADAATPRVVASLALVGVGMATFSAPNTSAVMGSVRRDQLSVASAFLGTMRTAGQALSVAVLGGLAAGPLGAAGSRLLFSRGHAAGAVGERLAAAFIDGYHRAMAVGTALAVVGALASLTRGPAAGPRAPR